MPKKIKNSIKEFEVFKILLLGDVRVGKNTLLSHCDNIFTSDYKTTIGVQFGSKTLEIENTGAKLVIFQLEPHSEYASYRHLYFKDAEGAILMYDITRQNTFKILPNWIEDVLDLTHVDTKIAIIGNKTKEEKDRAISKEEGEKLLMLHPSVFLFEEINAKTGENVEKIFVSIAKKLLKERTT
ncbi:MAG: Rab family GTPase [Candidatus Hodarchaeota archaeon]